jgi:hypothetical protein
MSLDAKSRAYGRRNHQCVLHLPATRIAVAAVVVAMEAAVVDQDGQKVRPVVDPDLLNVTYRNQCCVNTSGRIK